MQQNPFDRFDGGQAPQQAPQQRAPLVGPPPIVDPYKQNQDALGNQRSDRSTDNTIANTGFSQRDKLRSDYNALPQIKEYRASVQSLAAALKRGADGSGDVALIYDYVKALDPASVVREAEVGMASSGASVFDAAAARLKKELGIEGGGSLPPEVRQRLRREIINSVIPRVKQYNQFRDQFGELASRNQFDPYEIIGKHDADPYVDLFRQYDMEHKIGDYAGGDGAPITGVKTDEQTESFMDPKGGERVGELDTSALGPGQKFAFDESGVPFGIVNADGSWGGGYSQVTDEVSEKESEALLRERGGFDLARAESGEASLQNGVLLGLGDEIKGVAGGVGSFVRGEGFGKGYKRERDVERAAQRIGGPGAEIVGSLLTPAGILGQAKTVGQFAGQGGAIGALAGFGQGEGGPQSAIGAGVGGLIGVGGGAALSKAPALIDKVSGSRAVQALRPKANPVNREVIEAGERQSIPIRQPDARPNTRNAFAVVEASPTQGRKVRDVLDADRDAVQARLGEQGGKGTRLDNTSMGETVQGAGQRYIVKSREQANALYKRAETLAGDAMATPVNASMAIRRNIQDLKENGEKSNAGLIKYLRTLNDDMVRDGAISIDALRSIRTNMRGQISERNLTATDAERRVLSVLDAASEDIERALAKNPKALGAYKSADAFYREKQTFIKDVVQKFTGSRNNPLSAEQAASKFQGMMRDKGDYKRFSEMLKRLDDGERSDMAASIAESLGTARNGEFSLAALSTNVSKLNPRALRDLFGEQGAKAIADLRIIARAKADTHGGLNNTKSGVVAVGTNKFADVLLTSLGAIVGGGAGGGVGAVAGAVAGAGARTAAERFSSARTARLLLNPDFTKWLRQTPNTANPEAINRHFDRLNKIASREQAFLMDAQALQEFLRKQFSEGVGRAAATGNDAENDGRK